MWHYFGFLPSLASRLLRDDPRSILGTVYRRAEATRHIRLDVFTLKSPAIQGTTTT